MGPMRHPSSLAGLDLIQEGVWVILFLVVVAVVMVVVVGRSPTVQTITNRRKIVVEKIYLPQLITTQKQNGKIKG